MAFQDLLTVDNRYKDLCAQLDSKIQSARDALNAEVAKLNDTDKDLYKEMSDLKEKQADYYARLENIKLTHEHDKQALEAQIDKLVNSLDEEVKKIYLELQSRKQALATQEIMKNWEQKMLTQLRDLNTHDQQYDSRNSTLNELQQELIRQDMLLLKQSKILAVNTVLLKTLVSDRQSKKPETLKSGKEGLKMDKMP